MKVTLRIFLIGLCLFLGLLSANSWAEAEAADEEGTTLYQDVPNASEVLEALGEKPKIKYRGPKTRSIIILSETAAPTPSTNQASSGQASADSSAPRTSSSPRVARVKKKKKVAYPLVFVKGSEQLTPESIKYVDVILASLNQKSELNLHISGHTDTSGGNGVNIPLSARRAEAVKQYLVNAGVDPVRITTSGEGSTQLLIKNNPTAPENRRVEFVNQN